MGHVGPFCFSEIAPTPPPQKNDKKSHLIRRVSMCRCCPGGRIAGARWRPRHGFDILDVLPGIEVEAAVDAHHDEARQVKRDAGRDLIFH